MVEPTLLLYGVVYALVFLGAQRMGFLLHWRGLATKVSIEEFTLVAGLLLLPAPLLVAAVGVSAAANQLVTRRPPLKAAFNVGQYLLASGAAALVFTGATALGLAPLWASLVGPAVFALVSQGSTALLFARLEGERFLPTFRSRFLHWTIVTTLIGTSLGAAAYALFLLHPALLLAVVPIFLLLARFGRLAEWAEEEVRVHKAIAEASTRMAATGEFDVVAAAILGSCGEIFGAGEVRLSLAIRGAPRTWTWRDPQGAGAHGIRVVVPTPVGEPGELTMYPRPGQRRYGARDRYLLTILAASAASAASGSQSMQELREANQRLSNANRELEEFTLWTTHDMREPLRSVAQLAQILHDDIDDLSDAEAKDLAERVQKGANVLKERIKALHEFSRIVQEDVPFETLPLDELVLEARDGLAARIAEQRATIRWEDDLPVVRGQRARLAKVFCNLFENALKHTDKARPVISVSHEERPDEWEFSVRDNGPGIDPAFHERAFKLFQRGPTAASAKDAGSGAGLAIVKRIVEQHGGRVWIRDGHGGGADFRFTLPKAEGILIAEGAPGAVEVRVRSLI